MLDRWTDDILQLISKINNGCVEKKYVPDCQLRTKTHPVRIYHEFINAPWFINSCHGKSERCSFHGWLFHKLGSVQTRKLLFLSFKHCVNRKQAHPRSLRFCKNRCQRRGFINRRAWCFTVQRVCWSVWRQQLEAGYRSWRLDLEWGEPCTSFFNGTVSFCTNSILSFYFFVDG